MVFIFCWNTPQPITHHVSNTPEEVHTKSVQPKNYPSLAIELAIEKKILNCFIIMKTTLVT
jgi:hypothetical protein